MEGKKFHTLFIFNLLSNEIEKLGFESKCFHLNWVNLKTKEYSEKLKMKFKIIFSLNHPKMQ